LPRPTCAPGTWAERPPAVSWARRSLSWCGSASALPERGAPLLHARRRTSLPGDQAGKSATPGLVVPGAVPLTAPTAGRRLAGAQGHGCRHNHLGPSECARRGPFAPARRSSGGSMAHVDAAVAATAEPAVQMIGVNKWFGEFHVLRDINLTVDQGEKIVICGP